MKYNIEGYNQQQLIDAGLDCVDAVILRWYADFQTSGNMVEIEHGGKKYYWLKYEHALKEIPIIGINNKKTFYRRLKVIVEAGILEHHTKKSGGTFSCYRLTEKYYNLISDTQKSQGCDSKVTGGCDSKVTTKDSSIKLDSSIKYSFLLEFWNKQSHLMKHKIDIINKKIKKKHIDILDDYTEEEITHAVCNYNIILASNKYFFKYSWTLWEFIERGIEKFVDSAKPFENFKKTKKYDDDDREDVRKLKDGEY